MQPVFFPAPRGFSAWVPGVPEPAGSPQVARLGNGRMAIVWQKGPRWTRQIRDHLASLIPGPERPLFTGPVKAELQFFLEPPRRPKYPQPGVPPDIDKLERAALDGLTLRQAGRTLPLVIEDDARIIDLHSVKSYCRDALDQGLLITVWALEA